MWQVSWTAPTFKCCEPVRIEFHYRALGYNPALLMHAGWAGDFQKLDLKAVILEVQHAHRSAMWDWAWSEGEQRALDTANG